MSRHDEFITLLRRVSALLDAPLEESSDGLLATIDKHFKPDFIQLTYTENSLNLSCGPMDADAFMLPRPDTFPATFRKSPAECLAIWREAWTEKQHLITNFRLRVILTTFLAESNTNHEHQP